MAIDIMSQGSPIKNSHHIMKNPYLLMVKPPFPKPSLPYLPGLVNIYIANWKITIFHG